MPRIAMRETPLHVAAAADVHKVAGVLLKYGANANAKDSDGRTPRDNAMKRRSNRITALLDRYGEEVHSDFA